jgi:hypothetical protein
MRFVAAVVLSLAAGSAYAQQPGPSPVEQRLKMQMGEIIFSNAMLAEQVSALAAENAKLKAENEELKKAKKD